MTDGPAIRPGRSSKGSSAPSRGASRSTLLLFVLAGFLATVALMGSQLQAAPSAHRVQIVVLRKLYRTTTIETVIGAGKPGSSVSRSVSGSAAPLPVSSYVPATTHSS